MTAPHSSRQRLLVASLVLNAFLLGAVGMHLLGHRRVREAHQHHLAEHPPRPDRSLPPSSPRERHGPRPGGDADHPAQARLLRKIVRAMGGPHDPRAEALLRESRRNMKETRTALRAAHAEVERALLATPYDQKRMVRAVADLNLQSQAAQQNAQGLLVRLASQLTPEERALLERWSKEEVKSPRSRLQRDSQPDSAPSPP